MLLSGDKRAGTEVLSRDTNGHKDNNFQLFENLFSISHFTFISSFYLLYIFPLFYTLKHLIDK